MNIKNKKEIVFLFILCICVILFSGFLRFADLAEKSIQKQLLADTYQAGSDGHVGSAIHFLTTGSFFGPPDNPFFGLVPRSLVYSFVIAVGFLIFGVHIWVPWFLNGLFFIAAVLFLYRVSQNFLNKSFAILPAIMLACFWGAFQYVWIINTETLTLFLITFFVYSMIRYHASYSWVWIASAAASFALLIVTKATFYYMMFLMPLILAFTFVRGMFDRLRWRDFIFFTVILVGIVSFFRYENLKHLGSSDFSRGGHQFLAHAKTAEFEGKKMFSFAISQFVGDYITDLIIPGYAENPEPLGVVREIAGRWREDRFTYVPELNTDMEFWKEGKDLLIAHPIKFIGVFPFWFARLNGPVHFNLAAVDHMFVGTHPDLPVFGKIVFLMLMRILWYGFIVIVFWEIGRNLRRGWKQGYIDDFIWILVLVLYTNGIYAMFTATEVRYVLPVMPFYFLCVAMWCEKFYLGFKKRHL